MSGLEVLAILGFALGTPGVALAIAEAAGHLHAKAVAFHDAPVIVKDFEAFAQNLRTGELSIYWALVEKIYNTESEDQAIKRSFEQAFDKLKALMLAMDNLLERLNRAKGIKKRFLVSFGGDLKALKADIDKWKYDFHRSISIYDIKNRMLPKPHVLSNSTFKTIVTDSNGSYVRQLEQSSHFLMALAEYKPQSGVPEEILVAIERSTEETSLDTEDVALVASHLVHRVSATQSSTGILQCLGYRESPELELVFLIPKHLRSPQTLRSVIGADKNNGYAGGHSLNDRLRLAGQVADALLSVHIAGLVHKNIRSDSIILFQDGDEVGEQTLSGRSGIGKPFLTDWKLLRAFEALSDREWPLTDWIKGIYRHPNRQGLQPQHRYNLGHDIYSLGVVLLEIGLWQTFVLEDRDSLGSAEAASEADQQTADSSPFLPTVYTKTAVELQLVTEENSQDVVQLTKPLHVQKIFVAIAQNLLPARMGTAYAALVRSCLTCLEGGFGEHVKFDGNAIEDALKYKERVLEPLSSISI